jgi:hypothetical protein
MAQSLTLCQPPTGLAFAVGDKRAVATQDGEPSPLADRQVTSLRPHISLDVSNIEFIAGRSRFGVRRGPGTRGKFVVLTLCTGLRVVSDGRRRAGLIGRRQRSHDTQLAATAGHVAVSPIE